MLLDLEEFFVERDKIRRVEFALRGELLLGIGEDLFTMSEKLGGHGGAKSVTAGTKARARSDSLNPQRLR